MEASVLASAGAAARRAHGLVVPHLRSEAGAIHVVSTQRVEKKQMNKQLAKSIGSAAREARKALQLTQEDAAERINVSVEFYARIERGTSLPSIGTFTRMVAALGVSADALLGQATQPAQSAALGMGWAPAPPSDGPELRRLMRRLRKARSSTLRLVSMLVKELEGAAASNEQIAANDDAQPAEPSSDAVLASSPPSAYVHEGALAR